LFVPFYAHQLPLTYITYATITSNDKLLQHSIFNDCNHALRVLCFSKRLYHFRSIKDKKGKTLPVANVLLSGYQIGAVANKRRQYLISNLKPGNCHVLVQMIGYLPASIKVIINDKSIATDTNQTLLSAVNYYVSAP
jgi:hypothetical protein